MDADSSAPADGSGALLPLDQTVNSPALLNVSPKHIS